MKSWMTIAAGAAIWGISGCGGGTGQSSAVDQAPAVDVTAVQARDITKANRQVDVDLNLITRVYVSEFQVVEFYEPEPGTVLISTAGRPQRGTPSIQSKELKDLSPSEVFRKIAPGHPVPAVITRAEERSRSVAVATGATGEHGNGVTPPATSAPSADVARGANAVEISLVAPKPLNRDNGEIGKVQLPAHWPDYYCEAFFFMDYPCPTWANFNTCDYFWDGASAGYPDINHSYTAMCPNDADGELVVLVGPPIGIGGDTSGISGYGNWSVPRHTVRDTWVTAHTWVCYGGSIGCVPKRHSIVVDARGSGLVSFEAALDRTWD